MVTMAQRIEQLRTQAGLSRPALAEALGLPRTAIEKFETGRQTPGKDQQEKLASFFGVSGFYLRAEKGTALLTDWREEAQVVKCTHWHESEVIPVETAAGLTKTMAPRDEKTTTESEIVRPESDVHDFYRNWVATINGEATQLVTHPQLMRVMKIMEAAFESDRVGAPVVLDDVGVIDPQ